MHTLALFTVLGAGLLAGFEVGVHYGFGVPPQSLDEKAQLLLRQTMIRRLRVLAPAIFVPTLILGIGLTVQEWHVAAVRLHAFGLASLGIWIVIRIVRTVPVNSATLEWNPDQPPANWRELIERTERFHVLAAWAAVSAFLCFLLPALNCR